jgi:hypothetical protein
MKNNKIHPLWYASRKNARVNDFEESYSDDKKNIAVINQYCPANWESDLLNKEEDKVNKGRFYDNRYDKPSVTDENPIYRFFSDEDSNE